MCWNLRKVLARRLKIDEGLAAKSYAYLLTEHRAFRGEGRNDARGLAEMVRLNLLLALYPVVPARPRVRLQVQHGSDNPEEGGIVINVQKLLLSAAPNTESHPALALLSRARRAWISRIGNGSAG